MRRRYALRIPEGNEHYQLEIAMKKTFAPLICIASVALAPLCVKAQALTFSSASASFTQLDHSAAQMINGVLNGENGWAIYRSSGQPDETLSESALFVLETSLAPGAYDLTVTLHQNFSVAQHLLGHFAFGYVTDVVPTLASDSTALPVLTAASLNGAAFSLLPSGDVLAGGSLPGVDVYTIGARLTSTVPVTGILLRAINDASFGLPTGGPGRAPNGNFVISEFEVSAVAVPEPGTWALWLAGLFAVGVAATRRDSRGEGARP
jgi:hypothetical protein